MSYPTKMAPNQHPHHFMLHGLPLEPVSRTYQYRKIMKPMLERKRRARINKCLDELKDLMTSTLQADGENLSKLEKADILELTVRHLHRLRETNGLFVRHTDTMNMEKFWAGFQHCAVEVSHFLQKYNQPNKHINGDLFKYIANYVPNMAAAVATAAANANPAAAATTTTTTTATQIPNAHMPQSAVAIQIPSAGSGITCGNMTNNINAHYQRFCTALRQHHQPAAGVAGGGELATGMLAPTPIPTPLTAASASSSNAQQQQQQLQVSASTVSSFERIWKAAARAAANGQHRMHPYARKTLHNHGSEESGESVTGSGGGSSDDGDAADYGDGDFPAGDGPVWRPW